MSEEVLKGIVKSIDNKTILIIIDGGRYIPFTVANGRITEDTGYSQSDFHMGDLVKAGLVSYNDLILERNNLSARQTDLEKIISVVESKMQGSVVEEHIKQEIVLGNGEEAPVPPPPVGPPVTYIGP